MRPILTDWLKKAISHGGDMNNNCIPPRFRPRHPGPLIASVIVVWAVFYILFRIIHHLLSN